MVKKLLKKIIRLCFRLFPVLGGIITRLDRIAREESSRLHTPSAAELPSAPEPETAPPALPVQEAGDVLFDDKAVWSGCWSDYFGSLLVPKEVRAGELKQIFYRHCGYYLDLDHPRSFNQKLQWLKLNYYDPRMARCVDKCEFKRYVAEQIGEGYTIPNFGEWESENQIDFEALPERFVLKSNVQSDGRHILVVPDKAKLDIDRARTVMSGWLEKKNNLCSSYCIAYHDVRPRILAEEFIGELGGSIPDYKFMCFHGKVRNLFVTAERHRELQVSFYDPEWNLLPFTWNCPLIAREVPKPKHFREMIEIAEKLAEPFPFVRVDFYESADGNRFYVGEMTFYPGGGYEPFEPALWDYRLGDLLTLPEANC